MKKLNVLFPIVGGFLLVVSILGIGLVNAEETRKHFPFVEKLSQKLGLSQEKVEKAINEIHDEQKAEMDKKLEARLDQAVKDGKITQDQKKAILEKFNGKNSFHYRIDRGSSSSAGGSAEGEVQGNVTGQSDLETWAAENGLTLELLRELLGGAPGSGSGPKSGTAPVPVNDKVFIMHQEL